MVARCLDDFYCGKYGTSTGWLVRGGLLLELAEDAEVGETRWRLRDRRALMTGASSL